MLERVSGRQEPWDRLWETGLHSWQKEWRVECLFLHTQSGLVTLRNNYGLIETRLTGAKDYKEIHLGSFT